MQTQHNPIIVLIHPLMSGTGFTCAFMIFKKYQNIIMFEIKNNSLGFNFFIINNRIRNIYVLYKI